MSIDTIHSPLPTPGAFDASAPYRVRWRLDASDAYRLEHRVVSLLGEWVAQGTAPEAIAILCPDAHRQEDWAAACRRADLALAGQPPHWDMEALAPLETLLRILAGGAGLMALTDAAAVLPGPWQDFLAMAGIQGQSAFALLQGLTHLPVRDTPYQQALQVFLADAPASLASASGQAWLDRFSARRNQIVWVPDAPGIYIGPLAGLPAGRPYCIVPALNPWLSGPVEAATATLAELQSVMDAADIALVGDNPAETPWDLRAPVAAWLAAWGAPPETAVSDEGPTIPRELVAMARAYAASPWTTRVPVTDTATPQAVAAASPMTLSPSSVDTFLKCPRQFFYAHLLQLRETGVTLAALTGTLTHHLLEAFNRENPLLTAPLDWLTQQTDALFTRLEAEADAADVGLHAGEWQTLKSYGPLQRQRLHQQLLDAFAELDAAGYFQQPGRILEVEKSLYAAPPEFNGIGLTGRADLLREHANGTLEVIDYKTTRNRFTNVRTETNMRPLLAALSPVDWEEPDTHRRSAGRDLQLPLYALMLQHSPEYQHRPVAATIQLVRPGNPSSERPAGSACPAFTLTPGDLADGLSHVRELLQRDVMTPLQSMASFPATGNPATHCGTCPYAVTLCEGPPDMDAWEMDE